MKVFWKTRIAGGSTLPLGWDAGARHRDYHAILKEGKWDMTCKYELLLVAKASSYPTFFKSVWILKGQCCLSCPQQFQVMSFVMDSFEVRDPNQYVKTLGWVFCFAVWYILGTMAGVFDTVLFINCFSVHCRCKAGVCPLLLALCSESYFPISSVCLQIKKQLLYNQWCLLHPVFVVSISEPF